MPSICKVLSFYSSTRIKGKPMDISKYVTVTINDCRFIPFINRRGPVRTPIAISRGIYETLKSRGYKVILMASYNKSGKLVPTNQKILGKNTVFSAINKPSNVNKPTADTKAEEKKEEQKQEAPVNKPTAVPEKEEKKEEQKQEAPVNKQEVQKASAPTKEVEKKEDNEVEEEVKEETKKEEKSNKSLKIFKNK